MKVYNTLKIKGIEEYEKNTLNFIAEFLNTYTLDILSESKQFANLSDRSKINIEDVKYYLLNNFICLIVLKINISIKKFIFEYIYLVLYLI